MGEESKNPKEEYFHNLFNNIIPSLYGQAVGLVTTFLVFTGFFFIMGCLYTSGYLSQFDALYLFPEVPTKLIFHKSVFPSLFLIFFTCVSLWFLVSKYPVKTILSETIVKWAVIFTVLILIFDAINFIWWKWDWTEKELTLKFLISIMSLSLTVACIKTLIMAQSKKPELSSFRLILFVGLIYGLTLFSYNMGGFIGAVDTYKKISTLPYVFLNKYQKSTNLRYIFQNNSYAYTVDFQDETHSIRIIPIKKIDRISTKSLLLKKQKILEMQTPPK